MAQFTSDGLTLAYDEFGPSDAAKAMVLVHGFSSNRYENWKRMGWYDAIAAKGLRGFALDCRGHGESAKPHEPEKYDRQAMARDVFALMDHAGVEATSEMLFVNPAYVRRDKLAPGSADSGVTGDPTKATAEIGRTLVQFKIDNALAQIRASLAEKTP